MAEITSPFDEVTISDQELIEEMQHRMLLPGGDHAELRAKQELFTVFADNLDENQWRFVFKNFAKMKVHERSKVRKSYSNLLSED